MNFPLRRRHLATALAAGAVLSAGGWAAWSGFSATRPMAAPDVRYTLLDGRQTTLATLKGQVVLVNFWATTCTICVGEMPQLVATYEKFRGRGFATLAVSMAYDPPALVAEFAERRRLPFGVAIDNTGAIAQGFGDIAGTPTSFLLNRRGEIVERWVGAPDFAALERRVEALLQDS